MKAIIGLALISILLASAGFWVVAKENKILIARAEAAENERNRLSLDAANALKKVQAALKAAEEDLSREREGRQRSSRTRFVGPLPANIDIITALIEETKRNSTISIRVDHCGYGFFSEAEKFSRYKASFAAAVKRGVRIVMRVYDDAVRDVAIKNQFQAPTVEDQNAAFNRLWTVKK